MIGDRSPAELSIAKIRCNVLIERLGPIEPLCLIKPADLIRALEQPVHHLILV